MPKVRKMLSNWDAPYIQALVRVVETQSKVTLARAIGQSSSAIHSATHCIGLALYGANAVAYDELGTTAPRAQLESRAAEECARMLEALRAVAVENEPNPAKINWRC